MDFLVSSTYEDLKEERAAAIEAVDRVEHAVRMENFSSSSVPSRDECLLRLQGCDGVVLLIGDRYGSIDSKTGYSVTELEYRTAKEFGLPVLAFLKVGKDGKWHSAEEDPEKRAKHETFKHLVDPERTRTTFRSSDELRFEVAAALGLHAKRYGRIGARGSVFQAPHQFFQKYLDPARVYNHTFPIVGRRSFVEQLRDTPSMPQRVFILPGAGGMGKSKILHAGLAELQGKHPDVTICLLAEGSTFTLEHANELPSGQIVIVVDDAHRVTTGLRDLFAVAQQFSDRTKLILSSRMHGLQRLRQDLAFAGFDSQEILELSEVRPLSYADVEALAAEIVGQEAGPRLAQLISISRDSPLITVIAGQLFIRSQLDPALLTTDNSGAFRYNVLSRFQDELVGQVAAELDPKLARKVLCLVAALTPLDASRSQLVERSAEFLEIEPDEFLSALDILERCGVLVRRSGMLRISPDVLSDHVLHEACFTAQGGLKDYGKRIIDAFREHDLRAVLQNMAELDWRVSRGAGTGLLQEAWRDLLASYQTGSDQERLSLLRLVAPVAYFQPSEALALVRLSLQAAQSHDADLSEGFRASEDGLAHALVPILRDVAYYREHAHEAAALLWRIGRDDNRPLDKTSEHPIRILQELSAFARGKRLAYNELLLSWLEELVRTDDAFQHLYSPIDIMPALLRREGTETWSQGRTLIVSGFLVDAGTTALLRSRVLTLMHIVGQRRDPALRRKVVKTLVNVIVRGIMGLGNTRPTTEQIAVWQDEDRAILSILSELLAAEGNPAVLAQVEDDLLVIRNDPRHTAISSDVTHLIEQLPITLESTLIRYLRQGRIQRRLLSGQQDTPVGLDAMEAKLEEELSETIDTFFAAYSTPNESKRELEHLFGYLAEAGAQPSESYFLLQRLCQRAPDAMLAVCALLVADPESQALNCLPVLLTELREHNAGQILSCLRAAEASASLAVRRTAAWALGIPRPPATEEEQGIICRFAQDADRSTALAGIRALSRFPIDRYEDVIETLDQITVAGDAGVANQICQLFDAQWGINPEHLPRAFICRMLDKLVPLADWAQLSDVQAFVGWVTTTEPECAAKYYLARIAHQHELPADLRAGYSAVPHVLDRTVTGGAAADANADEVDEGARMRALRNVRDSSLQSADSASDMWRLTEVFARLSQQYAAPALDVLKEWIDSGEPQKVVNAAELLQSAGPNFVFTHEQYVVHLLEMAHKAGVDIFQWVQDSLIASTQSGLPAGWVGAPDPKDEIQRDRAMAVFQRYPTDHVAYTFYRSLSQIAIESIERNSRLADMLDDEWQT